MAQQRKPLAVSRRSFLRGAAAASAGAVAGFPLVIPSRALGKDGAVAPSNRLALGVIGTGGRGMGNTREFISQPNIQLVGMCDTDAKNLTAGQKSVEAQVGKGDIKATADYRELCARKDLDIVLVATPDHLHALASVEALRNGKDVYCEKPLANSVGEGRMVVEAAKRYNRVFQTGSQERSGPNARHVCQLVRDGRIGKVHTVRINLPDQDRQHKLAQAYKGVPPEAPVPEGLDWDRWLGHTPKVPYHRDRCHFMWRFILAYGGGEMTDRGAHVIDLAGLGLGTDDTGPIDFDARGVQTPGSLYDTFWGYSWTCNYANGVKMIGSTEGPRGIKFAGTDGWIFIAIHGGALEVSDPAILGDYKPQKAGRDFAMIHKENFLEAVKTRGQPNAPAETGHRTASICHLLNLSMKLGKKLEWDPKAERITNDESANQHLMPKMREPYVLSPAVS